MSKTREIIIESKKYGNHTVLIDEEDWEKVSQYNWHLRYNRGVFYAITNIPHPDGGFLGSTRAKRRSTLQIHRLIVDVPQGLVVDHKNHNGLDNRKSNLRVCTPAENARNRRLAKKTASGYKGVRRNGSDNCWQARIRIGKKLRNIGCFATAEEAALAYDAKALELFGEYAHLNFPDEPSQEVLDLISEDREKYEAQKKQRWGYRKGQFRGITKHAGKWRSKHRGEELGRYDTPEEAARAYDERVIELYGEYAYLNFPEEHNRKDSE